MHPALAAGCVPGGTVPICTQACSASSFRLSRHRKGHVMHGTTLVMGGLFGSAGGNDAGLTYPRPASVRRCPGCMSTPAGWRARPAAGRFPFTGRVVEKPARQAAADAMQLSLGIASARRQGNFAILAPYPGRSEKPGKASASAPGGDPFIAFVTWCRMHMQRSTGYAPVYCWFNKGRSASHVVACPVPTSGYRPRWRALARASSRPAIQTARDFLTGPRSCRGMAAGFAGSSVRTRTPMPTIGQHATRSCNVSSPSRTFW